MPNQRTPAFTPLPENREPDDGEHDPDDIDINAVLLPKQTNRALAARMASYDAKLATLQPGRAKKWDVTGSDTSKSIKTRVSRAASRLAQTNPAFKRVEVLAGTLDGKPVVIARFK